MRMRDVDSNCQACPRAETCRSVATGSAAGDATRESCRAGALERRSKPVASQPLPRECTTRSAGSMQQTGLLSAVADSAARRTSDFQIANAKEIAYSESCSNGRAAGDCAVGDVQRSDVCHCRHWRLVIVRSIVHHPLGPHGRPRCPRRRDSIGIDSGGARDGLVAIDPLVGYPTLHRIRLGHTAAAGICAVQRDCAKDSSCVNVLRVSKAVQGEECSRGAHRVQRRCQ